MPSAVALFEAARLSAWGLGLILVYLSLTRSLNAVHWHLHERGLVRVPTVRFAPPRSTAGNPTTFFAMLLGLIPILAFTQPIAAKHVGWLSIGPGPWASLCAVWLLCIIIVFLLWKLAFNPKRKMLVAGGWVALSHVVIWLPHGAS